MKIKYLLMAGLANLLISPSIWASPEKASFPIKNETSFYLFAQPQEAGCPARIAPGETQTSTAYWCGYVACATDQFDVSQGCMETVQGGGTAQGGYATWFSLSFTGGTTGKDYCTVPEGNTYQCHWDSKNGAYTLDYFDVIQKYSTGPLMGQPVTVATPAKYETGPYLRGINISGMEYNGTFLDALYQHPDLPDVKYFIEKGINTVRLPIRWEYLLADEENREVESHNPISTVQNSLYLAGAKATVQKYLDAGLYVVLDLHNYMRFCGAGQAEGQNNEPTSPIQNGCKLVNTEEVGYIWTVLAQNFQAEAQQYPDHLMFSLMNEPFPDYEAGSSELLTTQAVFDAQIAALKAIRKIAPDNLVLFSGNFWNPLHGFVTGKDVPINGDKPNGAVFTAANFAKAGITDLSRIAMEVHQYFDADYSGRNETCNRYEEQAHFEQSLAITDLPAWMRENHMKFFLGEFGASDTPDCHKALEYMFEYMEKYAYNPDAPEEGGFIGWALWRANRHAVPGSYAAFNFLQQADYTVYGAQGSANNSPAGTGISQGQGNGLMELIDR